MELLEKGQWKVRALEPISKLKITDNLRPAFLKVPRFNAWGYAVIEEDEASVQPRTRLPCGIPSTWCTLALPLTVHRTTGTLRHNVIFLLPMRHGIVISSTDELGNFMITCSRGRPQWKTSVGVERSRPQCMPCAHHALPVPPRYVLQRHPGILALMQHASTCVMPLMRACI